MLADQRAHGANIFPCVQNKTHVTQDTNQKYVLFKLDVRRNIHVLTSDLVKDFNQRQALFDLDRENKRPPPRTLSVNHEHHVSREHYYIILSGREADWTRGISALAAAFHNVFSNTKNLRTWGLCGALPLMRAALKHRSVHGEVARNATIVLDECFDTVAYFSYQNAAMLEVEVHNHKACVMLTQLGFKGDAFKRCARRRVDNISARVSTMSSKEEQFIALAKSGFNLSSMFFTVGPRCLSTDAIFKVIEHKQHKRKVILEEMKARDKGREAAAKERKNKGDY
jgi:hypothetical protein